MRRVARSTVVCICVALFVPDILIVALVLAIGLTAGRLLARGR